MFFMLFLQTCGHCDFCFECVQNLDACPICNEGIIGWKRLKIVCPTRPSKPFVFSMSDAFDDSPLFNFEVKSNALKDVPCAEGDNHFVDDLQHSDDEHTGLVTWVSGQTDHQETNDRSQSPKKSNDQCTVRETKKPGRPSKRVFKTGKTSTTAKGSTQKTRVTRKDGPAPEPLISKKFKYL